MSTQAKENAVLGGAVGVGALGASSVRHPLMPLGVIQNFKRVVLNQKPQRGKRRRQIVQRVENLMPRALKKTRVGRRLIKTMRHGRRMTLYHTTSNNRVAGIVREGLRAGRGGTFNPVSPGQVFMGKAPTVLAHHYIARRGGRKDFTNFMVRGVRRGSLVRDWQHAGAYVSRHARIAKKLVKPVSMKHLALRSIPAVLGAAGIGAGLGYLATRGRRRRKGRK